MRSSRWIVIALIPTAVCVSPVDSVAQELAEPVRFVRPANPKPLGRVDATVRGRAAGAGSPIKLIAMTPMDDGPMTATAQPTLYWYLSARTDRSATFSLRRHESRSPSPIFECEVRGPIPAGVHEIKLGDHQISLDSNADYSWFVRLQDSADAQPSTAFIVVPDLNGIGGLREELAAASAEGRYKLYMRRSFWYDALATIVALLESVPLSSDYRGRYLELLKDGGLDDVAARVTTPPRAASTCSAKLTR
jgi:uncharacterized protein DUF928